ncbi:hypothetical protein PASE110613_08895 [Paenibacillus sediminis]|uniref:Uncharacterized protein n=1 Tax=Paenibacillus sediminis TaxID=664909 RepID=A0ABS4H6C1_9BACL|nr:hypothetical protein [Paenibacillus sediminis]
MINNILAREYSPYSLLDIEIRFIHYLQSRKFERNPRINFEDTNNCSLIYFSDHESVYIVRSMNQDPPEFKAEVVEATNYKSLFDYLEEFHGNSFANKIKESFMSQGYPRY